MELLYSSTRNAQDKFTASQAILKGLADDGGLFVPERIPSLDVSIDDLVNYSEEKNEHGISPKRQMTAVLKSCKNFAETAASYCYAALASTK